MVTRPNAGRTQSVPLCQEQSHDMHMAAVHDFSQIPNPYASTFSRITATICLQIMDKSSSFISFAIILSHVFKCFTFDFQCSKDITKWVILLPRQTSVSQR